MALHGRRSGSPRRVKRALRLAVGKSGRWIARWMESLGCGEQVQRGRGRKVRGCHRRLTGLEDEQNFPERRRGQNEFPSGLDLRSRRRNALRERRHRPGLSSTPTASAHVAQKVDRLPPATVRGASLQRAPECFRSQGVLPRSGHPIAICSTYLDRHGERPPKTWPNATHSTSARAI